MRVFKSTGSGIHNLSEPVVIREDEHVHIEQGARLVSGDFPAVIMAGNHSTLTGYGWLEGTTDDPILQIGTSDTNVTWPLIEGGIKIKGIGSGVGVKEVTPLKGKSTYWGKINNLHIEKVDVGVLSEFGANGQEYHGVSFQRIKESCYRIHSDMFGIFGGSVHFSPDVIVHDFQGARFGYSEGVRAEPGAGSRFAVLDHATLKNQIRGVSNIGQGPIDNGRENHIEWQSNAD